MPDSEFHETPGSLISILIPCFNAQDYVGDAIESALSQDYARIEVIVVDDGSTDDSLEVIQRYASDPRFRYEVGPNRGGNAARNRLLQLSCGEYVQFLDADDLLAVNKVTRQLNAFGPNVDAVFCDYVEFRNDRGAGERTVSYPGIGGDALEYFIGHSVITMLPLHRRSTLVGIGGFDETLQCCQEYELQVRLAAKKWRNVVHISEALCRHRRLPTAVSANEVRVFVTKARLIRKWHEISHGWDCNLPAVEATMARVLYQCARHLARQGQDKEADEAFQYAERIAPGVHKSLRVPLRILTKLLGPIRAEKARSFVSQWRSV